MARLGLRSLSAVIGVVWLVACGGSSPEKISGPPTIQSFTASPSTLPYGGGTVTLSWSVSGATSLSIDHGVGDVTGTTHHDLSGVTTSSTWALTATNASGSVNASVTVAVASTENVTGRVYYADKRTPAAGATVLIPGHPTVTTAADGSFTVTNVTPPYDLYAEMVAHQVTGYLGLTRADPTLSLEFTAGPVATNSSTLSGSLSGGTGYPAPSGHDTWLGFYSTNVAGATGSGSAASDGTYSMTTYWSGSTNPVIGTLVAVEYTSSFLDVTGFDAYATVDNVQLLNGGSTPTNVTLTGVTTGTIGGNVAVPSGYALDGTTMQMEFPGGLTMPIAYLMSGSTFSHVAPSIPGATFTLSSSGHTATGGSTTTERHNLTFGMGSIQMDLYPSPDLVSPADASTLTAVPSFQWTGSAGVNELFVTSGSGRSLAFVTEAKTLAFPDLSALGEGVEPSTSYSWFVRSFAPQQSVDQAAATGTPVPATTGTLESSTAVSPLRHFTSAP